MTKLAIGALIAVAVAGACGKDAASSGTSGPSGGAGGGAAGEPGGGGSDAGSSMDASSAGGSSGASAGASGSGGGGAAAGGSGGGAAGADSGPTKLSATVVTFNTGTTTGLAHDSDPTDGYTSVQADISDQQYGDGLAWKLAMDATRDFFAALQPDIVAFQEIFHSDECANIAAQYHPGFACEGWSPGDPTVAQYVLGAGYQVACHIGKPDKCLGVRTAFGTFQGCSDDLCLDGLAGAKINNCGGGSRVGRGVIDLVGGGTLTVVNIHGTSGVLPDDQQCRIKQIDQIFIDVGDGSGLPAANGARNVVLGDLNTDPGRAGVLDFSAVHWNNFVGPGKPFHFVSDVGPSVPPSYAGVFNIDHVMSDALGGTCWTAGVTPGHPDVYAPVYFDHKPVVCDIEEL